MLDKRRTASPVINASLAPSALNVFLDGTLQLSNIPYTGVSNYQKTTAGAHSFRVEATSTPGATLMLGPSALGLMSKLKISVGKASVAQA